MKIKNLKYILCITLGIIIFISGISLAACTDNPNNPNLCKNSNGGADASYDNSSSVTDTGSLVYLKLFHNGVNLSCKNNSEASYAANIVRGIQQSMKTNCPNTYDGCVDGRFGSKTRTALQTCAQAYCSNIGSDYSAPTLDDQGNPKCDGSYDLVDEKCCKPKPEPEPAPTPTCDHIKVNGLCETGFMENPGNTGCCIRDCGQAGECVDGEIWSSGACKCVCDSSKKCCGIQLNTVVPFIGDCIELDTDSSRGDTTSVNSVTAFPVLMQGLMKILMSVIMVFSFIMVIVAGLMMTVGAFPKSQSFEKGKTMLKNVIISLILLGCSGLILSLINPTFFK